RPIDFCQAVEAAKEVEIGRHGHLLVEAGYVGDQSNVRSDGGRVAANVISANRSLACGEGKDPSQHPDNGRFTGAIRAEEREEGTVGYVHGHLVDRDEAAKTPN